MKILLSIIKQFFRILFYPFRLYYNYHVKMCWTKENLLHRDNVFVTLLVFVMFASIGWLASYVKILDPLGDAFADVELTDVAFSRMNKNESFRLQFSEDGSPVVMQSPDVVIINVGNAGNVPRGAMSGLVEIINGMGPKVIGVDAFFREPKDPFQDSLLAVALAKVDNLVLVSEGRNYDNETNTVDSLVYSHPMFLKRAHTGCATMDIKSKSGEHHTEVLRMFTPFFNVKKEQRVEPFFATKICELYDSTSLERLMKRNRASERINYFGNIYIPFHYEKYGYLANYTPLSNKQHYLAFDYPDVFNGLVDTFMVKGKIVLFGFLGDPLYKAMGEDKFYTPLNNKYIGTRDRDMFGVVTYANIISMILEGNYIDETPNWLVHLLGVFAVWLTFVNFRPLYNSYKIWYDGVSKILSFGYTLFILLLIGLIFEYTNFEFRFGALYFGCILLAGDFLEIYYGVIKNVYRKFFSKNIEEYE